MRFLKDGKEYAGIIEARNAFCHACGECFMRDRLQPGVTCSEFCKAFPEYAAVLMGYTVVGCENCLHSRIEPDGDGYRSKCMFGKRARLLCIHGKKVRFEPYEGLLV